MDLCQSFTSDGWPTFSFLIYSDLKTDSHHVFQSNDEKYTYIVGTKKGQVLEIYVHIFFLLLFFFNDKMKRNFIAL